ncbi:hypothetical protein C804_01998 [Lachnospiraceae bacterium A4]|nr:hypothetical protein C804_01998 [Lachnospiraceae bacterium A4]
MSEGIAYQNKDILFKILGQTYKKKALRHTESISRLSGNCFRQTCRKSQQTKKTLTICSCWKTEPMPLLIMRLNSKN